MAFNPQTINKELDMANLAKHNANYSAIKTELDVHDTHVAAQTAHGSTSAATAGKIMQRDSAGRAKVAAPSASDDIARKAEVDAVQTNLDEHEADNVAHLSTSDREKLDGLEVGAEANQNAFAQVNNVIAGAESDTLTIAGGTGITVSTNPTTKTLTVTATGEATPGAHGSSHNNDGADPIPDLVALRGEFDALTPADIGAETPAGAQAKVDALAGVGNTKTVAEVTAQVVDLAFNAKEYGAIGDNTSDDSDAIETSLNAASGKTWLLPEGTYKITRELVVTTPPKVIISRGTIKAIPEFVIGSNKNLLTISGNEMSGNFSIDCNNNGIGALRVNGDNNNLKLNVKNILGVPLLGGNNFQNGLYLVGNRNRIQVHGENLLHGSAGVSDAVPRLMSIDSGSQGNIISATGYNVSLGIVINDKNNTIDYLELDGGTSGGDWNGIYALVPSENTVINNAIFRNWRQQMISFKSKGLTVNSVSGIDSSGAIIALEDGSDIQVNSVSLNNQIDAFSYLLWARPGNTLSKNIRIKNISMKMGFTSDNSGAIIQITAGTINNISITEFDATLSYTAGKSKALCVHTAGDKIDYRNGKITVIDTTGSLGSSDVFQFILPAALDTSKISFWKNVELICEGNQVIRIVNAIQEPVIVEAGRAFVNIGPYLTNQDSANTYPVQVWSSAAPTIGSWVRSSVVWNIAPSANGYVGWVCTTSGSPGVWKGFGLIQA
nr:hypothetical protein [Paenibacillus xylanexedens]